MPGKTVLITGFEPFDGDTFNASWQAVRPLDGLVMSEHVIRAICLPVTFADAPVQLLQHIDDLDPAFVICVGEAREREVVSLEQIACNLIDARLADNTGTRPVNEPVVAGGPADHRSTLPLTDILTVLGQAGIAAELSQSAGTFVCNATFYALMDLAKDRRGLRAGFIHIPAFRDELRVEAMTGALRIAITTTIARSGTSTHA